MNLVDKKLYLDSPEYHPFDIVREVVNPKWIEIRGKHYLLVRFDTPIRIALDSDPTWQSNEVYLANRFVEEESRFRVLKEFPVYVIILGLKRSSVAVDSSSEFHTLAWATLHARREDAQKELDDWRYARE